MILIRSIFFQVYFFASVCFFALLIAIFAWIPYSMRFVFANLWGKSMLWVGRWLCGMRYQFEGLENIPDEPSVVLIKHSTVFETYAQLVVFPPRFDSITERNKPAGAGLDRGQDGRDQPGGLFRQTRRGGP